MRVGRVLKTASDRFAVDIDGEIVTVKSRKKIKRDTLPLPGDIVTLESAAGEYVLSRIEPRKCRLIRPPIANVDQIVITIAPVPAAELANVDKLLIGAHRVGVRTVVCVNKTDLLPDGFLQDVFDQYRGVADETIAACAAKGDVSALQALLKGRFTCFAGQSAVGKTSLINEICGSRRQVGGLSEKTQRGKNTTTGVELIRLADDTFVADTPGFGALDLFDIEYADLPLYYDEYVARAGNCKYHMCTHTVEPDCAVRSAAEKGELNGKRYERYKSLFAQLKQQQYGKPRRNTYENK